jgi:replicative DNA helicase
VTVERIPPHNVQAEESLLGAMLLSREAIAAAIEEGLSFGAFYKPAHGHIFAAITSLYAAGQPVDPVTVAEELRRSELLEQAGGPAALVLLQAHCPALSNAGGYARIVANHDLLRQVITTGAQIAEIGYSCPADVNAAVAKVEALTSDVTRHSTAVSRRAPTGAELLAHLRATLADRDRTVAIPTGVPAFDALLAHGGWRPGVVLLGGLAGVGKTAFALQAALSAANAGHPVVYLSVEQSPTDLLGRIFCRELGRPIADYWNRDPAFLAAIEKHAPTLHLENLHLPTDPHLASDVEGTVGRLRRWSTAIADHHGTAPLVVVDYLQRMRPPEADRRQDPHRQISMAGLGLLQLARDLSCPVLALSSINRAGYDKTPSLDAFKGSGDLEYDADAAIVLRIDATDAETARHIIEGSPDQLAPVGLHVVKNRYGPVTTAEEPIRLRYDRRHGGFREHKLNGQRAGAGLVRRAFGPGVELNN